VPPGFRRLTPPGGVSIDERNNDVSIGGSFVRHVDLELQVPTKTNLRVHGVATGGVTVENVDGELEINTMTGPVTLTDVSGAVVVQAVSAPVTAKLSRVAPDKPMSFASFTGNVDVTLPASVKATFKLRSSQGDVFTNFDLQTKAAAPQSRRRNGEPLEPFLIFNDEIYGTVNGGGPEIELRTFHGRVMLRKGS
jgi:hypothetical protein